MSNQDNEKKCVTCGKPLVNQTVDNYVECDHCGKPVHLVEPDCGSWILDSWHEDAATDNEFWCTACLETTDKLTHIQNGDTVGYYGSIRKSDGSRDKLYGEVAGTHEVDGVIKLLVTSHKFSGLTISVNLKSVFERHRVIPGEGTETHYFDEQVEDK